MGFEKQIGREGEEVAAQFLEKKGYRILEKNYRCRKGEIDLIAEKGKTIFFVEVKTRNSFAAVSPLELLSRKKQVHLVKGAKDFIARRRFFERPASFALLVVDFGGSLPSCEMIEDLDLPPWGY